MTLALLLSGWLAGVLTVLFALFIGLRWFERPYDRSDQLPDKGRRAFVQHGGLTTAGERNDHA